MSRQTTLKKRIGILLGSAAVLAFLFAAMPAEAASKDSHKDSHEGGHKDSTSHAQGADHKGGHGGAGGKRKGKGGSSINRGGGHKSLRDVFQDMDDEGDDHGTSHSDGDDHGTSYTDSGSTDHSDKEHSGKKQFGKKRSGKKPSGGDDHITSHSDSGSTDHGGKKQSGKKASGGSKDAKPKKPSTKATAADEPTEDSDRPEWAGTPGKEGKPGRPNTASGTKKGDLFGDMYVLLRDVNGIPILNENGFVQPVDADGNPLALDEEGHLLDPDAGIEVELGRLNVGRAPERMLSARYDEALRVLNEADTISVDATGRITYNTDGVVKTIDSPLENLALYVEIMNTGTLGGIVDTTKFTGDLSNLVDGTITVDDYVDAAAFFAAASDKTGSITIDQIVYMNTIVGIGGTLPDGFVEYTADPLSFDYNRQDVYGDVNVEVLIQQPDGTWAPTTVNVYETLFGSTNYISDDGGIDGFAQAADDARAVIEYVHEYDVPTTTTATQ